MRSAPSAPACAIGAMYQFHSKMKLSQVSSAPTIGAMIGEVDLDGKSVDDVVEAWIKANESTWKKWGACAG